MLVNLYPESNYSTANNQFNYVFSQLDPTNRLEMKYRFDWNITNNTKAYVRIAHDNETAEGARGVWWGASDVALPSSNLGTNHGRSYSGNVVSVLSPTTTNEALVSWSRLTLDNTYSDPSQDAARQQQPLAAWHVRHAEPVHPRSHSELGRRRQQHVERRERHVCAQRRASVQRQADEDHGCARPEVRRSASTACRSSRTSTTTRKAGWSSLRSGPTAARRRATRWATSSPARSPSDIAGTRGPDGEFRFWNFDGFAQDSWKLKPNLTLEYGARVGYWTNNQELNGLGGYFNPSQYDPIEAGVPRSRDFRVLNGVCYVSSGCAPSGILDNRSPFAMPRVNLAWDIDGEGKNVLRGGYGMFYNRNMGNVEYDTVAAPDSGRST